MRKKFRHLELLGVAIPSLATVGLTWCVTLAAGIDAIFFVVVASEQPVSLNDCHVAFWTLRGHTDPCRHGCSSIGGARLGLNTFEAREAVDVSPQ